MANSGASNDWVAKAARLPLSTPESRAVFTQSLAGKFASLSQAERQQVAVADLRWDALRGVLQFGPQDKAVSIVHMNVRGPADVGAGARHLEDAALEFDRGMQQLNKQVADRALAQPQNYGCLTFNLLPFQGKVHAIHAALGNVAGTQDFYLDPANSGNFSLNVAAMPARHSATRVETKDVAAECLSWLASERRIFYKSDTQGFDELIATTIRPEVWPRVAAGIMEVWRIEKPRFDVRRLVQVLDQFPNKVFLANADLNVAEIPVSTLDVLQFIKGNDRLHRDLAFWR